MWCDTIHLHTPENLSGVWNPLWIANRGAFTDANFLPFSGPATAETLKTKSFGLVEPLWLLVVISLPRCEDHFCLLTLFVLSYITITRCCRDSLAAFRHSSDEACRATVAISAIKPVLKRAKYSTFSYKPSPQWVISGGSEEFRPVWTNIPAGKTESDTESGHTTDEHREENWSAEAAGHLHEWKWGKRNTIYNKNTYSIYSDTNTTE